MYNNDLLLHYIYYVVVTHRILQAYIHSSQAIQYVNVSMENVHRFCSTICYENSVGKFRKTPGERDLYMSFKNLFLLL